MRRDDAQVRQLKVSRDVNARFLDALCADGHGSATFPYTLIIAAHPDDETISAGGRLVHIKNCTIVHVTDGAPRDMIDAAEGGFTTREAYARARQGELAAALAVVGIGMDQTRSIGLVDQEASLDMPGLALGIAEIIRELEPAVVLTHPYEGGHPDHDATAFATHAARRLVAAQRAAVPELIEFTSYHDKDGRMSAFEFLPCEVCCTRTVTLSDPEYLLKRKMMECFTTQTKTIARFAGKLERFRVAPDYDFTVPAHAGTLYYERFNWGMTGARWRELARAAMQRLGLAGAL